MEKEVKYGTVIWFSAKKGIGFIQPDEGGKDFFCHYSNVVSEPGVFKTLIAGQRVSFVIGANKNGPQAEQIMVLSEPEAQE
jgi:CspA family cold shock protein